MTGPTRGDASGGSTAAIEDIKHSPESPASTRAGLALRGALLPMLGREADLDGVRARLADPANRLLTLVGPLGVGKSRLALAAAALWDDGSTGVRVVDFAASGELDARQAAAAALGLPAPHSATYGELVDHLRRSTTLLVLDGCDLVRDRLNLVAAVLSDAPAVRVLATSRAPLGMYGEQLFIVRPLAVPDPCRNWLPKSLAAVPAVALFLRRVAAVRPDFKVTEANCLVLADLCRRLDGLPLAIEYAAARLKVLQPQALLVALERDLDVLGEESGLTADRQGSFRAALRKHVETLPGEARSLLADLSVFAAGFDLAAMEAVAGQPHGGDQRALELLVDKSLVQRCEQSDDDLRFALLNTTRTLVREVHETAGRSEALHERHANYFLDLAVRSGHAASGPDADQHLSTLAAEHHNVTEAFQSLLDCDRGQDALRMAAALVPHLVASGRPRQGLFWIERALSLDDEADPSVTAPALHAAGRLAAFCGAYPKAVTLHRRALELYRRAGDEPGAIETVHQLGFTAYLAGDLGPARSLLEESSKARRRRDATGSAQVLVDLAALRLAEGCSEAARPSARSALGLFERNGDAHGAAAARAVLAGAALADRGPLVERTRVAEGYCMAALAAVREHDPGGLTAPLLEVLAATEAAHEASTQQRRAVRLLAAAQAWREACGLPLPSVHTGAVQDLVERLRQELGPQVHAEEWDTGRELTPDAAVNEVTCDPQPDFCILPLTPRQREVAELIGHGLTNREIARRLGVSEWTAINHVRHVLRKLQCSSRVQVTRLMTQREAQRPSAHPHPPAVSRS